MIRLRRGTVLEVTASRPGVEMLMVRMETGEHHAAIAYTTLVGFASPGAPVLLNTTAAELGLGTGGVHIVVTVEGIGWEKEDAGREMKLRYTPHQLGVPVVEHSHREQLDAVAGLGGMPVVICALHSAVPPVAIGVRAASAAARIAYVMTEGGSLIAWFSETIPRLRAAGLIDTTITTGQAIGGDLEAVTLFGALAAARAVVAADVVIVGMGPGNLGTGSRWGSSALEVGTFVNAVAAMGGAPIVAPRISFTDERERHRGVSHHTITALETIALARATVAVPTLAPDRAAVVRTHLAKTAERHDIVEVVLGDAEQALVQSPVELQTMGRAFEDDPDYFRAAAAAGVLAARSIPHAH